MTSADQPVFLVDADNTLLDNDRFIDDLMKKIESEFGVDERVAYQNTLEELRLECGFIDYLGALQRLRLGHLKDPKVLGMSEFVLDYPFADNVYPGAMETVAHLSGFGLTVMLSDGDGIFQPRKIQRSGIWRAFEGRVLIFVHKEEMLDTVEQLYPAKHYVMVDDKQRILSAMKDQWRDRLTTIFPRQGHYALNPENAKLYSVPDLTVERIGDLGGHDFTTLPGALAAA